MLRSHLFLAGLVACGPALAFVGCGGDDSTATSSTAGVDETGRQPPAAPAENPGDGAGVVLAINKLYLGDTDRTGKPDAANGWKDYGFNLDHLISTKDSTNLCTPRAGGAPAKVYPDGNEGIDNAFGKLILPIILGLAPDASTQLNDGILEGSFTIMLAIDKLGAQASYNPLLTKLYAGGDLCDMAPAGCAPKFDGTDQWPLINELLNNGDKNNPKIQFPKSYVTDNTWVSGTQAPINLALSVAGFTLNLTIGSAVIAMDLNADHKGASNGTIAGIIDTESFIGELQKVAGAFDPGLCTGSTFESLAGQLRQASDILKDGSQNPAVECDGISIGLGFDMKEVQLGTVLPPAVEQPNPCEGTATSASSSASSTTGAGGGGGAGNGAGGN